MVNNKKNTCIENIEQLENNNCYLATQVRSIVLKKGGGATSNPRIDLDKQIKNHEKS